VGKDIYTWPVQEEIYWQGESDIIMKMTPPTLRPGRGLRLQFRYEELQSCKTLLEK
jgi:hypothetical protein